VLLHVIRSFSVRKKKKNKGKQRKGEKKNEKSFQGNKIEKLKIKTKESML